MIPSFETGSTVMVPVDKTTSSKLDITYDL